MSDNTAVRAAKLDKIFGTPVCAVLLAIFCNVLWGSAFPFIKLGYRLFSIDSGNTASIFCFAGVRFMLGSVLVLLGSILLQGKAPRLPRGRVAAECCALGLWQTTAQYAFYYIAVAMLTGAFGGILNSTQSFLGVIFAHFIYGNADRMTPAKTLGCAVGFAGVLIGTIGNHGGGSGWGVFCMMAATIIFTLSGPWNKSVTKKADSFAVCFLNLFVGGLALFVLGTVWAAVCHVQSALACWSCCIWPSSAAQAISLWALLMKNNPVSRIAIFGFVNPVVNVLLSAVLNGEPLFRWQYLAALVFVCVGIWLVNKAPAKKEELMTGPIFDTHAHYSARAFDADRFALLDSLPGKGVVGVCEQATHSGDAPRVLELAHRYPWVVAAVGIHPESLLPAADCGEEGPALPSRSTAATGPPRCVP
ncbi:MAG: TatD family hydrolase [Faecalibacterium prausnitzii]